MTNGQTAVETERSPHINFREQYGRSHMQACLKHFYKLTFWEQTFIKDLETRSNLNLSTGQFNTLHEIAQKVGT